MTVDLPQHRALVSFVHGYLDPDIPIGFESLPSLWALGPSGSQILSYPFPRSKSEFDEVDHLISGEPPSRGLEEFSGKARFGMRGLAAFGGEIFCGTFNSIHVLDAENLSLKRIISNHLTNDLHGIYADHDGIYFVLPGRDLLAQIDFDGAVLQTWTINPDLSVEVDESLPPVDWRFVAKQKEGPYGAFHFNYVRKENGKFWLTSRNLGAVVLLTPGKPVAELLTIAHNTPVMLHDGVRHGDLVYFTSVDGKIIPVDTSGRGQFARWEVEDELDYYRRGYSSGVQRLQESELRREPSWCRGFEKADDIQYVTIDGRIGGPLSFGLLGLRESGEVVSESRLDWTEIGETDNLRYVTGFDILLR